MIPEDDVSKLEKIGDMGEVEFASVVGAMRETAPSVLPGGYAAALLKKNPALKEAGVNSILTVVLSLSRAKEASGMDFEKVVELVTQFLTEAHSGRFPAEKLSRLRKRIQILFEAGTAITVGARSLNLLTACEHLFTDARIFSDIRPVFGDPVESAGAVIIHNLRISFRQNDETQEFFVALDNNDLERLKAVIDRAEKKTKTMIALLERSKVPFFDVKSL
jgi:hypothetical protein